MHATRSHFFHKVTHCESGFNIFFCMFLLLGSMGYTSNTYMDDNSLLTENIVSQDKVVEKSAKMISSSTRILSGESNMLRSNSLPRMEVVEQINAVDSSETSM